MTYPIAVLTTRPGQGATTFAISLAWDLAAASTVMLIDFDMAGGTIADALEVEAGGRSIANLLTLPRVDAGALAAQAVTHTSRGSLTIVPGLRGFSGPSPSRVLPRFDSAFASGGPDYAVIDLGCPLAYPDLESPRVTAEAISASVRRTFVVLRDDPTLLPGTIQLLKHARVPQADLVILRRRGSRMARISADVLNTQLPGYPTWQFEWDERKGQTATYEGRVLEQPGVGAALHIGPAAQAAQP